MRTKVLLFEGYDGAGKTTLISNLQKYLSSKGLSSFIISDAYNKIIDNINFAMKDEETEILPETEILLRFAREHERLRILNENIDKYDYILIDRGVPSAVSWIHYYAQCYEHYEAIINVLIESLGECILLHCHVDFDDSWLRVLARTAVRPLSKKERRGKEINSKVYSVQRDTLSSFNHPLITKYTINMEGTQEECLGELLKCLNLS